MQQKYLNFNFIHKYYKCPIMTYCFTEKSRRRSKRETTTGNRYLQLFP